MKPTLAGFLLFIQNTMQIPMSALPTDDIQITYAFYTAMDTVLCELALVSHTMYMLAVYNLAASNLLNMANDQPGQTYFADIRQQFNLLGFVGGVIQSSADNSTSESMAVPDAWKGLTIANLQQLKDPYGRAYLSIAQTYGPIWGLS